MAKKTVITRGKRKTAIARATIKKGSNKVTVNSKPVDRITPEIARNEIKTPLKIAKQTIGDKAEKFRIKVNVEGGGYMSRAEAVKVAIAKGLVEYTDNKQLEEKYLKYDRNMLVDDIRRKEAKKPLRKGARARYQKSYR